LSPLLHDHPCASRPSKRVIHAAQTLSLSSTSQARYSTLIFHLARVQCRRARVNGVVIRNDDVVRNVERFRDRTVRVSGIFFRAIFLISCIDVDFIIALSLRYYQHEVVYNDFQRVFPNDLK